MPRTAESSTTLTFNRTTTPPLRRRYPVSQIAGNSGPGVKIRSYGYSSDASGDHCSAILGR